MADSGVDLRLVPAAAATWLAGALATGLPVSVVASASVMAAAVGGCLALRLRRADGGSTGLATALLALVGVVAVLASAALQLAVRHAGPLPGLVEDGAVVQVVGAVRSEPLPVRDPWAPEPARPELAERYRVVLQVERVTGRGRTSTASAPVLVVGDRAWADVAYGSTVTVHGRLSVSSAPETAAVLRTTSAVETARPAGPADRAVRTIRQALLRVTDDLPPDARGLVPGAAVGDTSRIPADLSQAMRDVSLTHVTAVSGGHFAILSMAVLALTAAVRAGRPLRAVTVAAAMAGFVVLVHPQPSVLRAAAMGAAAVAGLLLGRPSRAVPALSAAVVGLVVLDPWLARRPGFVLSVLATAAIVVLAPRLAAAAGDRVPRAAALALAVPVAAQAVCGPVVVLLDPAVSPYAVLANLLAAPALVPATLLGVAAALLAPLVPVLAEALVLGASAAVTWIATVARVTAAAPGARLAWPGGVAGAAALAAVHTAAVALLLAAPRLARAVFARPRAP